MLRSVTEQRRFWASHGDPVYAIDRQAHGLSGATDLQNFGQRLDELRVTGFAVPDQQVKDFINDAFGSLYIRLISKEVRDQILVAEQAPEG